MSPSPLPFPQEVIDKIVDDLEPEDDLPSLLNCSLISRSFLAASRRAIFNQLSLGTYDDAERCSKDCRGLFAIVSANPQLGSCIKRIVIQDSPISTPDPEKGTKVRWISSEEALPLLLPFLVSLKFLAIRAWLHDGRRDKLDWSTFPPRLAAALSRAFMLPSLVKIEFVELRNIPSEIVTSSRYLKGLSLWGTDLLEFNDNSSSGVLEITQPQVRSQLESLEITNCALIIPTLIKLLDLSCLKILLVGLTCAADFVGWPELVDCISPSLEELDIIHMYDDEQFCIPHELLDLRPFPNLRVFSLDIAYYVCETAPHLDVLPILLNQLQQITSDSDLEEFRLRAEYGPPPNDVHVVDHDWLGRFSRLPFWQELDSILTHPRFSKLRRVAVLFERTGDGDLEPWLHDLRRQIPGLVNKKIVFFEFTDD